MGREPLIEKILNMLGTLQFNLKAFDYVEHKIYWELKISRTQDNPLLRLQESQQRSIGRIISCKAVYIFQFSCERVWQMKLRSWSICRRKDNMPYFPSWVSCYLFHIQCLSSSHTNNYSLLLHRIPLFSLLYTLLVRCRTSQVGWSIEWSR